MKNTIQVSVSDTNDGADHLLCIPLTSIRYVESQKGSQGDLGH